jgi:hypothetical protein
VPVPVPGPKAVNVTATVTAAVPAVLVAPVAPVAAAAASVAVAVAAAAAVAAAVLAVRSNVEKGAAAPGAETRRARPRVGARGEAASVLVGNPNALLMLAGLRRDGSFSDPPWRIIFLSPCLHTALAVDLHVHLLASRLRRLWSAQHNRAAARSLIGRLAPGAWVPHARWPSATHSLALCLFMTK